jgi:hypothetical protein
MAEKFPSSGLAYKDNISADTAPVHLTGFLNINHSAPPSASGPGRSYFHTEKGYFLYVSAFCRIWNNPDREGLFILPSHISHAPENGGHNPEAFCR